jgi:hypothetical protein
MGIIQVAVPSPSAIKSTQTDPAPMRVEALLVGAGFILYG